MIITLILTGILGFLNVIFGLFSLPAMPFVITAGFGYALDFMNLPLQVLKTYVGHEFFIAVLGAIVLLMTIEHGWALIQWIWHKVRG